MGRLDTLPIRALMATAAGFVEALLARRQLDDPELRVALEVLTAYPSSSDGVWWDEAWRKNPLLVSCAEELDAGTDAPGYEHLPPLVRHLIALTIEIGIEPLYVGYDARTAGAVRGWVRAILDAASRELTPQEIAQIIAAHDPRPAA